MSWKFPLKRWFILPVGAEVINITYGKVQFGCQLKNQVGDQVWDRVWGRVGDQVWNQIENLNLDLKGQVLSQIERIDIKLEE